MDGGVANSIDTILKLQKYYDDKLGTGKVSVGIGYDKTLFVYTHYRDLDVSKPDWLDVEVIVRYSGIKRYKTL